MSFLDTFAPASASTARAAAATIEFSQLRGTPVHLSVVNLGCSGRNVVSAIVQCQVDGIVLERLTTNKRWAAEQHIDCEVELQRLLIDEAFISRVLEPLAKDIAGLTQRTYLTDGDATQMATKVATRWTRHPFPKLN